MGILENAWNGMRMAALSTRGAANDSEQRARYDNFKSKFVTCLSLAGDSVVGRFTTPSWENLNRSIRRAFSPYPPYAFLRHPLVERTMFFHSPGPLFEKELLGVRGQFADADLKLLLREDDIGKPRLIDGPLRTSHNTVHQAYHLSRYSAAAKPGFEGVRTVVEWGGGYGNLAKMFARWRPGTTYVIIDTPLFSCVQWLYLTSACGPDAVVLVDRDTPVQPGRINVLATTFLGEHPLEADLFISTWALSESTSQAQDYVQNTGWFGAKKLLLAYQNHKEFPDAGRVGIFASKSGAAIEAIDFLPGNDYAFL